MSKPIKVSHSRGEYSIHFAERLRDLGATAQALLKDADKIALLVNENVAKLYATELADFSKQLKPPSISIKLPDGEKHKSLSDVERICAQLSEEGLSRHSAIIAIGGGVTTDLAGFIAASYMRGIDYIQVPTSLLAQVDASIGGKTGVNLATGKNLVGAFYPPAAVLISSSFLAKLPPQELSCGFAEIIKHALLADADFFVELESIAVSGKFSELTPAKMQELIRHSCRIKVDIVQQDEYERLDADLDGEGNEAEPKRALLNLGHTFAHALEAMSGYKHLKHGQAVAMGIVLATRISSLLGDLSDKDCARIRNVLAAAGLPAGSNDSIGSNGNIDNIDNLDREEMLEFMTRDKKHAAAGVPLILLKSIGQAYMSPPYPKEELRQLLDEAGRQ